MSANVINVQKQTEVSAMPILQANNVKVEEIKPGGFMHRLSEIMSEERVESFFRDYFATWSDAETSLMMMHAYFAIAQADASRRALNDKTRLSSVEIVAILRQMVSDGQCRKLMVDAMSHYTACGNSQFIEAFDRVRKANASFIGN